MKRLGLIFTFVIGLIVLAASASALTVGTAALGNDGANAEENVSTTFVVTNDGTDTLTGITISSTADSKFQVGFANAPTTLTAGQSATVTVSGFLHRDLNAIVGFDEAAQNVGSIVVSGTNSTSATISQSSTLTMQVENQIEIKKVKVVVNGEEEHNLDDGDDLDDLKPGDRLEFTVIIENNFRDSDDEDIEIEDIEVILEVDDDDEIDIDDDEDEISGINADSDDEVEFSVEVEFDASGSYTFTVTAKGHREDTASNVGLHGQKIRFDIDVERETHDLQILSSSLKPGVIACGKNSFEANVKLVNIGKRDEDEAAIEVFIPELGLSEIKDNLNVDKSDEIARRIQVILPTDTPPGTYNVELNTYWNTDVLSDQQTSTIIVEECNAVADPVVQAPPTVVQPPTTTTAPPTTVTSARSQTGGSFLDSGAGIAALIVGILAAILIIVFLIVLLVRKPAQ